MRRRYTRAAALGAAAAGAGAAAGWRLTSGGGHVPGPPGPAPSRHVIDTDFGAAPDRTGWGPEWVAAHYQRPLEVRAGRARYPVPQGLPETASDQTMPVTRGDAVHTDGEQVLEFSVDEPTLRPGLLLRSTAPYRYASVTIEEGQLVAADNDFDGRSVQAQAGTSALARGGPHLLRVRYQGGRIWARAWRRGQAEPDWQIMAHTGIGEAGDPGVVLVHPTSLAACTLSVARHRLATDDRPADTAPSFPVLVSGIPEPEPGGGHRVLLRAWTARPADLRFEWRTDAAGAFQPGPPGATGDGPFTALAAVHMPGRLLEWRVRATSRTSPAAAVSEVQRVTLPEPGAAVSLIGSACYKLIGARRNRGFDRLLEAAAQPPTAMVFEGDLGYAGNWRDCVYHRTPDYFADRMQRALADPGFTALRRTVATGFIMDDHEYGPDNNANRDTLLPWTIGLWDSITATPTTDGYFDFWIGDVHCLTLDGRRYADPVTDPNTPAKTKLGLRQREWLEHILRTSDAGMFLIYSGDMFGTRWNDGNHTRTMDCFIYGWPDEYRWAMTLFTDIQLTGRRVLLVSGDCHCLRINNHPDPARRPAAEGMRVTEFVCAGIRAELWEEAAPDDHMVDRSRYVVGRSGAGLIEIGPASDPQRRVTLRAIAAGGRIDAWRPLELPFGV
jgi:hypothetical protein